MPNIKIVLEYDGTEFSGWQKQPNDITIQEELEKAIEKVLKEKPKGLVASGRTDAGVHALAQVANFYVSKIENLPLVVANDIHYTEPSDQIAQEVLICIGSNKTLHDESRFRLGSDQFYFKSSDQMRSLFSDIPQACDQTLEITERCDVHFNLKDDHGNPIYHLPTYPTQGGVSLTQEMKRLSFEGLKERFAEAESRGELISSEKISMKLQETSLQTIAKASFGFGDVNACVIFKKILKR